MLHATYSPRAPQAPSAAHAYARATQQAPHAARVQRGPEPWCRIVQYADGYTLQFGGGDPAELRLRLEALKGAIPPQRRRWNPATRTWWIDPAAERLVRALSHWTDRWFAPGQVQRSFAPGATAEAWARQVDTGDSVAEGWVDTAEAGSRAAQVTGATQASSAAPQRPRYPGAGGGAATAGSAGDAGERVNWRQPAPLPAAPDAVAEAYAALWLRPGAPMEVVRAAYRALAALHHPDKGGDMGTMQQLNAAYALLRERGG
jgi:hypothetical protein